MSVRAEKYSTTSLEHKAIRPDVATWTQYDTKGVSAITVGACMWLGPAGLIVGGVVAGAVYAANRKRAIRYSQELNEEFAPIKDELRI